MHSLLFGVVDILTHARTHGKLTMKFVYFVLLFTFLCLQGARHPCVELMDTMQQFIANDYELVRDKSSFQIVTGPNMVRILCYYLCTHKQSVFALKLKILFNLHGCAKIVNV